MRNRTSGSLFCLLLLLALPGTGAPESATTTGISRDFNPAISVNTLLLYSAGPGEVAHDLRSATLETADTQEEDEHAEAGDGYSVQESELQLTSSIDPYAKANLIFAMHGTDGFEMEEGYAQATCLPKGLGLRAGKFYFEFGKHNALHTHQYPFVERPRAWDTILGEHGLNGAAVEASWLAPLPFYAEVLATAFPTTETIYGTHELPRDTWGRSARIRTFFESSAHTTLDIGLSYAGGRSWGDDERTFVGADLAWKWIGTGDHARKLEIQGEWLRWSDEDASLDLDGAYAQLLARVTRRWHVGARWDGYLVGDIKTPDVFSETSAGPDIHTYTLSVAFVPSEFQAFRVEALQREAAGETDQGIRVQYNVTIGSHPAHRY